MIDNGFVFAAHKQATKIKRIKKIESKKMDKLIEILRKKNITLDIAISDNFNKTELKLIKSLKLDHYLTMNERR
jgi:hypothetical protein